MSEGRRLLECVERWPECYTFGYDPRCCRFPKSCSAGVYGDGTDESLLEPALGGEKARSRSHTVPRKALVYKHPYLGILACCPACPNPGGRAGGDMYLMLQPVHPCPDWDHGTLAAAHDVAWAHMRDQHPAEAR